MGRRGRHGSGTYSGILARKSSDQGEKYKVQNFIDTVVFQGGDATADGFIPVSAVVSDLQRVRWAPLRCLWFLSGCGPLAASAWSITNVSQLFPNPLQATGFAARSLQSLLAADQRPRRGGPPGRDPPANSPLCPGRVSL
jgi:hypothetical protein